MRVRIINFLKQHSVLLTMFWKVAEIILNVIGIFIPIKEKTILFSSFGGRNFDDSPKAIFDEISSREEFAGWTLIWAFANPSKYEIAGAKKVKIDTPSFFYTLLSSKVWVSNSGITRGIKINKRKIIKVETWHGTPLKKICGEENTGSLKKKKKVNAFKDSNTIRCAQSEYDQEIFQRIFNATKDSILLIDLPRNDALLKYTVSDIERIKNNLGIDANKKVILYMPTYREYLVDDSNSTYIAPPMNLAKWERELGGDYILLFRAHYAVNNALGLEENEFVRDVSSYGCLNDLYSVADIMISDYSSAFFDYSILSKPMLCFAYDEEEYAEKRGLYLQIEDVLPCKISKTEDEILEEIKTMDYDKAIQKAYEFSKKFSPYAGDASKKIVDEIIKRL